MSKYLIFATVFLALFIGCNKPVENPSKPHQNGCPQHDYGDTIPPFSEQEFNSCYSVLKQYTFIGKECPFYNDNGKKVKICAYITDVGHIAYQGDYTCLFNFFIADDTLNTCPGNLDEQRFQAFKHIQVRIKDTIQKPEDFNRYCYPIYQEFQNHLNKKCFITGELRIVKNLEYPCYEYYPMIYILHKTDYTFEEP